MKGKLTFSMFSDNFFLWQREFTLLSDLSPFYFKRLVRHSLSFQIVRN